MKLLVFGGSGRTGRPVIEQALAAGHSVVALVRNPNKLGLTHDRLTLVAGDVMDAAAVAAAFGAGTDAVISVLGPVKGSPDDLLPTAVGHILAGMQRHDIRRLVYMTGAGVDMPQDQPQFINHVIKFALKTLSPQVLAQSERAVRMVQTSDREWVIVRAPMLTDAPRSEGLKVGWVGVNTGPRLSRADAAAFILQQVNGSEFVGKAPVISN